MKLARMLREEYIPASAPAVNRRRFVSYSGVGMSSYGECQFTIFSGQQQGNAPGATDHTP